MSNNGPCINCGEPTENTEHVCTDCTAGARARLRVRQLTNDELIPKPAHRPSDNSSRDELSNVALAAELGVSEATVRRARLVELADRGLITLDEIPEAKPHLAQGTGNNERYTPAYVLEAVRYVVGGMVELDPASSAQANETVQARRFFTLEDDGLAQDWEAESLWLNPPFGRGEIGAFVEKLAEELDAGNVGTAMVITHNATETGWCQDLLAKSAAICFLNRRVDFPTPGEGSNSGTLRGQIMFLLGRDGQAGIQRFEEAFRQLGVIYVPHARRD